MASTSFTRPSGIGRGPRGWGCTGRLLKQGYPGLEPVYQALVIGAIVVGYIVQRVIEGIFMRRYKMHIHVWRPVDSQFRLITARRNPNMVILFGSLLFGRPDVGLQLVACGRSCR